MNEIALLQDADERARRYTAGIPQRRMFPDKPAIAALSAFHEPLPAFGLGADQGLRLLDEVGSPATVASNGPPISVS
jgi:hypothetical protein